MLLEINWDYFLDTLGHSWTSVGKYLDTLGNQLGLFLGLPWTFLDFCWGLIHLFIGLFNSFNPLEIMDLRWCFGV
jgi:hypothetical protein